jgi:histone deacetylase complex regulatory component SIN3
MDATSASAESASAGAPAGGDPPANQKGKREVIDSDLESGEESNKISKENEITAEEVVAAPLAFATPSKTAFIQRADLVEFNHALDYISLIKNHFASSLEVYQQFIRIVNSTKDQKDQDHIGAILDKVALLFDTQAELLEGFVYFLPKQLQSWAKAKIEGKICMAQMIHIPE